MDWNTCPLPDCGARLRESPHLTQAFTNDPYGLLFARLVTHYRHEHLQSFDRTWASSAYARKVPTYRALGHDAYRSFINERAKRQIIRGILKSRLTREEQLHLIAAAARLEHQDPKTMRLMWTSLHMLGGSRVERALF